MSDTIAISIPRTAGRASQVRFLKSMVLSRDRSIPHLGRKIYHLVNGLACAALYAFVLDRNGALLALTLVGGALIALDLLRLNSPVWNARALKLFGPLMRREELLGVSANTYYVVGIFVVTLLFPKSIVLLSVLYLAVGDPVAGMVGTLYGRRPLLAGKSFEGSAANFAAAAVCTLVFARMYLGLSPEKAIGLAVAGGLCSAVAELLPLPINDNFSIPVVSAILLSFLALAIPF